MWSELMRKRPPRRRSAPWISRVLVPIPAISQPMPTSMWQRSWTWGSAAALRSRVVALGERGGHDGVLGGGDAGLVEEDVGAARGGRGSAARRPRARSPTSAPRRPRARKWVSMRRRPMTSPPGGGRCISPVRATMGPARRMEARMRAAAAASSWASARRRAARTRTSLGPPTRPRRRASCSRFMRVRTSRMSGTFSSTTSSSVSSVAASIGRAAFLLPAGCTVPLQAAPPCDDELRHAGFSCAGMGAAGEAARRDGRAPGSGARRARRRGARIVRKHRAAADRFA